MNAIHRLIEQHAASQGDVPAVMHDARSLSYRELNDRANRVARHLIAHGFKRGSLAVVRMRRSCDLAIVLLAVLKAGGAYTWIDDERSASAWPPGVSLVKDEPGAEQRCFALDLSAALARGERSPNLPILTRSTDLACVLPDADGSPMMLVPHATIAALQTPPASRAATWSGEPGALDLWMALMTGTSACVVESVEVAAA